LNARNFRIHNKRIYSDLESVLDKLLELIAVTPPDDWPGLLSREQILGDLPEIGNRRGDLEFWPIGGDSDDKVIVARCSISFPLWPFGGWVVYDGIRFSKGAVNRLTDEELSNWW
jgi:hypothetical protein